MRPKFKQIIHVKFQTVSIRRKIKTENQRLNTQKKGR